MRRAVLSAAVFATFALLVACSASSSGSKAPDSGATGDGATADASSDVGPGLDSANESNDSTADVADGGSDAAAASCVGASGEDAGTICSTTPCVDENWAQWPMPNSPADVMQGAPNAASYTVNGDGTVSDDVTKLMWQQTAPTTAFALAAASTYCASLSLAGHTDWRVPTFIELEALVDYSVQAPSIDTTAFPSAPPLEFWTSTLFAPDVTTAWEFGFGAGDSGQDPVAGAGANDQVRCVRGPVGASTPLVPPNRYAISSATVRDLQTGLTWQRVAPTVAFTWAGAKTYCASLDDGGTGWRVPTVKELTTIVDVTRASPPMIVCDAFPTAIADQEWTATAVTGTPGTAWVVSFALGFSTAVDSATALGIRCVR